MKLSMVCALSQNYQDFLDQNKIINVEANYLRNLKMALKFQKFNQFSNYDQNHAKHYLPPHSKLRDKQTPIWQIVPIHGSKLNFMFTKKDFRSNHVMQSTAFYSQLEFQSSSNYYLIVEIYIIRYSQCCVELKFNNYYDPC